MAIVIGLGTAILVYAADGFGINTKTGEIVQNGLLFVDSKPGGAQIYLNNKFTSTTSARLVLPSGAYDLALKKTGYRDWQRKFDLSAQTIARFIYPFLFPVKPVTAGIKTYPNQPAFMTQSTDRHWLLVQTSSTDPKTITFDEYDTTNLAQFG
jgi:hypothetical protein